MSKKRFRFICLGCGAGYWDNPPFQGYEDGHGGAQIEMCGCGSDLFKEEVVDDSTGKDDNK